MIQLGDEVKDAVTGYRGIAVGRSEFLHGCMRIGVQAPMDKDGKVEDSKWFDEPQLTVLKAAKVASGSRATGGPMPSIPTRNTPR